MNLHRRTKRSPLFKGLNKLHELLLDRQKCPPSHFSSTQVNVAFDDGMDVHNRNVSKANINKVKQRHFSLINKNVVF